MLSMCAELSVRYGHRPTTHAGDSLDFFGFVGLGLGVLLGINTP